MVVIQIPAAALKGTAVYAAARAANTCGVSMKRVFLWILGGATVLAVAAAVLLSRVDAGFVVRQIADATAKATGQPLTFDSPPGISFFPPGVNFGQAHWGRAGDGQGVVISVKSGMAQLELSPLLTGNVVVREVRLNSPVIEVREGKAVAAAKPDAEKPAVETKPAAATPPALPIELKRLVLRQGIVTYTTANGKTLRVDDVNFSVENLRTGQEAVVQCDFAFIFGDSTAEPAAPAAKSGANNISGTLAFSSRLRYAPPQLLFRQTALTVTPLTGALPKEAGPLQFTCEGSLRLSDLHLQLSKALLNTPQARVSASGEGGLAPLAFNGALEMEGSPHKLAALAGHKLATPAAKDDLRFRTMVRYTANALNLSQMLLQLDDLSLRGGLRLDLPENAPMLVTADVQTGMLNLDPYLPPAESGKNATETKPAGHDGASSIGKRAKPDAEAARRMPGLDIRAKVAGITKGGLQIKDIALAIKGEKGRYALTSLTASLGSGGLIKSTGNMDMATETCALKAQAADVELGPLLVALGKGRLADGQAALDADMTMKCADANDIRQTLGGRGQLEIRRLHVPAMAELSKSIPSLTGKAGPLPDRFDLARAPFTARDGEINASPITVTSATLNAAGKARISLPKQYLDAALDIKTMGLTIPVTAKGPLSDISYGVDPRFALDMAKNLPGALLKTGKEAGSTTKDAAKGAEGLVRGILGR